MFSRPVDLSEVGSDDDIRLFRGEDDYRTLVRLFRVNGVHTEPNTRTTAAEDCWIPTTNLAEVRSGHRRISVAGKKILIHRLVKAATQLWPRDARYVLSHLCNRPQCCNPAHLALMTTGAPVGRRAGQ